MLDSNKENNLENKNPIKDNNINSNLNEKLLNNKREEENILKIIPKNKEKRAPENMEEESDIQAQNIGNPLIFKNKNKKRNKTKNNRNRHKEINKNQNNKKPTTIPLEDIQNDITNITIPSFRNSDINRESFRDIVEQKDKKNDKKIENNNSILKIILLIIEIFLGILICISSILVLLILFKDNIKDKKQIGFIVEPIIFFITVIGIIPYKGKNYQKIVVSLYLWEGLFLFPFSFYSNSGIKDEFLNDICNKILIARIFLLLFQLFNFILSLILKINI